MPIARSSLAADVGVRRLHRDELRHLDAARVVEARHAGADERAARAGRRSVLPWRKRNRSRGSVSRDLLHGVVRHQRADRAHLGRVQERRPHLRRVEDQVEHEAGRRVVAGRAGEVVEQRVGVGGRRVDCACPCVMICDACRGTNSSKSIDVSRRSKIGSLREGSCGGAASSTPPATSVPLLGKKSSEPLTSQWPRSATPKSSIAVSNCTTRSTLSAACVGPMFSPRKHVREHQVEQGQIGHDRTLPQAMSGDKATSRDTKTAPPQPARSTSICSSNGRSGDRPTNDSDDDVVEPRFATGVRRLARANFFARPGARASDIPEPKAPAGIEPA